jgi:hypothetical protein
VLDLAPDDISSPTDSSGDSSLDLTLETNYGPLVQAAIAAINAASEIRYKMKLVDEDSELKEERPDQLDRIEVLSVFRPPPPQTADEFPFQRRQPVIVVGTKIDTSANSSTNQSYHRLAIKSILPAYRAAASAIAQLRYNHQNNISSPIEASQMAKAAASIDTNTDWDRPALDLIQAGIEERIDTLLEKGRDAEMWLDRVKSQEVLDDRQSRARLSRDAREAELRVLEKLKEEITNWSS